MKTYKLNKTIKGKKTVYTVTDETGQVLSQRTSTREYVACTANGEFYFGRLDLIGKGDHGKRIRFAEMTSKTHADPYIRANCEERLKELNAIAYL